MNKKEELVGGGKKEGGCVCDAVLLSWRIPALSEWGTGSLNGPPSLPDAAMAAPEAQSDEELQAFSALECFPAQQKRPAPVNVSAEGLTELLQTCLDPDNGLSAETRPAKPTEDLVNDFDEKLNACFQHLGTQIEVAAHVKPISEDAVLKHDE